MNDGDFDILLFDGVCNLCNGLVRFVIKRDKNNRIRFASLQSEAGLDQLRKPGRPAGEMNSVVLIQGDKFYIKSTAVLKLLKILRPPWSFLYGFIMVPKFLRDFVYDLVAKSRYKLFGKRDVCMVPTPELKSKFL